MHIYISQISIPKWKKSAIDPNVIIYIIEIKKIYKDKQTVEKRYSDYDELNTNSKKYFAYIPSIPRKGNSIYFKMIKLNIIIKYNDKIKYF